MTATTQPGITLDLDGQIKLIADYHLSNDEQYDAILASLIRLREIEGIFEEQQKMVVHSLTCPYPTMVQKGVENPDGWCLCGALDLSKRAALLLWGKP